MPINITYKKINTIQDEKKASSPLFERCYEFEQEETPEELRNDGVSLSDRVVIEMMRLGGCDGNPRGLYPPSCVASVWDKLARTSRKMDIIVQSERYEQDVEEIRKRIKEFGGHQIAHLYLDDSMKFNYMGVFVLDIEKETGYEFEGAGIHRALIEDLLNLVYPRSLREKRDFSNFIKGQYFLNPDFSEFTKEVNTKVVYFSNNLKAKGCQEILEIIKTNPFDFGGFVYEFQTEVGITENIPQEDKRGINCFEWFEKGVSREDLYDSQIEIAEKLVEKEKEKYTSFLKRANRVIQMQRKMNLIFLDQTGDLAE